MILKGQVSAMITENQVKNYLRSKDKDYVNKLIESLYEQDDEDIDPSHKACLYVVQFISRRMEKIRTDIRDISVLTVTSLLVIEPTPYSTGLILLWTSGFTSLNWNYIKCL